MASPVFPCAEILRKAPCLLPPPLIPVCTVLPYGKKTSSFGGGCPVPRLCADCSLSKCSQHSLSPGLRAPPPSILLLPTFPRDCLSEYNVGMFAFLISPPDMSFQRRKHLLILSLYPSPGTWEMLKKDRFHTCEPSVDRHPVMAPDHMIASDPLAL